jgi:dTDP-4-dehydrorhamnose reductase
MNIGITGASGMLGTALIESLYVEHKIYATSRKKGITRNEVEWDCFDLLDFKELHNWLVSNHLDVIIHCAAMVNVEQCEEMPELANKLHCGTTKIISEFLQKTRSKLIYISTDSLFDGKKIEGYTERDIANPLNIYAKTKLAGEKQALRMKNSLVLRTNIVGWGKKKISFAEWVIKSLIDKEKINLFDDVMFSPLHVNDLSDIINELIKMDATGLFNVASNAPLSKYDFGLIVADIFSLEKNNIKKSSIKDSNLSAYRPLNMSLSSKKLSSFLNKHTPSPERSVQILKKQYDDSFVSTL